MTLLRTTITGPIMAGVVVAVSAESIALYAGTYPIPDWVHQLAVAAGACSVIAHLVACGCKNVVDRIEGRIDSNEANTLYSVLVGPNAPQQRRTSPTPLRRVR